MCSCHVFVVRMHVTRVEPATLNAWTCRRQRVTRQFAGEREWAGQEAVRGDAGPRNPAQASIPRQEFPKANRNPVCFRRVVQVCGFGVWCVWLCHVTRDVQFYGGRQPPRNADNVGRTT